jgi:methionine aminopeptidase
MNVTFCVLYYPLPLLPGCSLNHVAAHYTPNYGEKAVALSKNDIMKLDFGIQVNGRILDSAFTVAFDPKFEPLVQSTQEGTWAGIKASGVDARSVNLCLHIFVPMSLLIAMISPSLLASPLSIFPFCF